MVPIPPKNGAAVKQDTMGILLTVADGNYDEIGYENVNGHNPVSANEISVGVNVARTLGIQAGDTMDIYIEGAKTYADRHWNLPGDREHVQFGADYRRRHQNK
ncbi:hypothetical protein ACFTAO_33855 [Paenibacillus rhizoplanae]